MQERMSVAGGLHVHHCYASYRIRLFLNVYNLHQDESIIDF